MTRAGPLVIKQPRAWDKSQLSDERVVFTAAMLPSYLRQSLRHSNAKGTGSMKAGLPIMIRLIQSASRQRRRRDQHHQIIVVLKVRIFTPGILRKSAKIRNPRTNT